MKQCVFGVNDLNTSAQWLSMYKMYRGPTITALPDAAGIGLRRGPGSGGPTRRRGCCRWRRRLCALGANAAQHSRPRPRMPIPTARGCIREAETRCGSGEKLDKAVMEGASALLLPEGVDRREAGGGLDAGGGAPESYDARVCRGSAGGDPIAGVDPAIGGRGGPCVSLCLCVVLAFVPPP